MSGKKIIAGLEAAVAFAQGDETQGRIVRLSERDRLQQERIDLPGGHYFEPHPINFRKMQMRSPNGRIWVWDKEEACAFAADLAQARVERDAARDALSLAREALWSAGEDVGAIQAERVEAMPVSEAEVEIGARAIALRRGHDPDGIYCVDIGTSKRGWQIWETESRVALEAAAKIRALPDIPAPEKDKA